MEGYTMKNDSLGDRMKTYESVPQNYLMRRTPVIIRADGCHFHSFTRGLKKPFDSILQRSMQDTMKYLCENIMGCVLGYTQSDEITLVLCDYKKLDTQAWFDNRVSKLDSVSAALATLAFNKAFNKYYINDIFSDDEKYINLLKKKIEQGAYFDSRAFNLQIDEVCNCLIWRQQDAERNSIQSLAQSLFSQKEMYGISCKKLQDKMFSEKGVNWNDLPTTLKRGSCCIYTENGWVIDNEIPIFSQDRSYVEKRIVFNNED
jgi:tRNA(His) 5'-end guanylyltransferase